jgi:outer membrane immunogenic protein
MRKFEFMTALGAALGAVGVVCLGAGSAAAQDGPWNGFYVGGNIGASWGDTTLSMKAASGSGGTVIPPGDLGLINAPISEDDDNELGFTGGFQTGYNYWAGGWMLGLETDISYFNLGEDRKKTYRSGLAIAPPVDFTIEQKMKTDWIWTLRPRIGFATDTWLFYATGGVAASDIKLTTKYSDTRATPITGSNEESDVKFGWIAGLGGAYALSDYTSVRGEWLYTDFGTIKSQGAVGSGYATLSSEADARGNLFRIGFDYTF